MADFKQTFGPVGVVNNAETINTGPIILGPITGGPIAGMPEAAAELEALKAQLAALPNVPSAIKVEATAHIDAAASAAKDAPKDKATVESHLDKAATVLKSATGFAGEVAGVLGAVLKIGLAVAAFVV